MFGGGGRRGGAARKQERRVKPTVKEISVNLEDVYNGTTVTLKNDRTILCKGCDGQGGSNVKSCSTCGGQGQVIKTQMIGPGMYQRMQAACDDCKGKGKVK